MHATTEAVLLPVAADDAFCIDRRMKKVILISLLLAALAMGAVAVASLYAYRTPRTYADTTLIITPGTGARVVLAQLHAAGLAPPMPMLVLPYLASGKPSLKAGEYAFEAGLSPAQIINRIARGAVVIHKLTIPEGWNSFQLRDALLNEPLLTGELPPIAEGSAFPDTMVFTRGEARSAVLARMQKAQQQWLAQLWETRAENLPLQSPEEALILASIVEKETGLAEERALVAGVFINRLRLGMMLQTDPSVVYGIEVAQGGKKMGRELTRNDLLRDTPYNSYTRAGLPPTPICLPGRASIEAVLHPATTDALYFVATGTGGHRFAATLEEHNRNVAEYRKALAAQP